MAPSATGQAPRVSALLHQVWDDPDIIQLIASNTAQNATTTILTIGAGLVGYITSVQLSVIHTAAAARVVTLGIYNGAAVLQASWGFDLNAIAVVAFPLSLVPPVKLLATWSIRLVSPNADVIARAMVTGYTLPA